MRRWRWPELAATCVLAAALSGAGFSAYQWWRTVRANATILALAARHDVPVSHGDPGQVQAARGLFLLAIRHAEEAQATAERMQDADPASRAILLYALANAHMRQALKVFSTLPMRQVAPVIQLAKSEYRLSLHLDPDNWDARYNFDIAASLVRDAEPPPNHKGDEMARERALFPDIPGAPNGLP
jgi:mxaK protein